MLRLVTMVRIAPNQNASHLKLNGANRHNRCTVPTAEALTTSIWVHFLKKYALFSLRSDLLWLEPSSLVVLPIGPSRNGFVIVEIWIVEILFSYDLWLNKGLIIYRGRCWSFYLNVMLWRLKIVLVDLTVIITT